MNVIETTALGRRFGWTWALRNCSLAIPAGRVTALVGPNGAGKSTLLHLAVGLDRPTEGDVRVLGGQAAGSAAALERVAFVAQDAPLYRHLPVADMVRLARNLSRRWDQPRADRRLAALDIPLKRKIGKLSGGQQAQVALTIALARRPEPGQHVRLGLATGGVHHLEGRAQLANLGRRAGQGPVRGQQVPNVPGHLDLAAGQHDQVVGHPLQLGQRVRGEQHRDAVLGHRLHHRGQELVPGQRVQRGQRLVEDEQFG